MRQHEDLILAHLDLVKKIARKLASKSGGDPEEFEADGMIGLIEAAQRYDPTKNNNFPAYAKSRIWGSMVDGYRASDKTGRHERELRKKDPERKAKTDHLIHTSQVDVDSQELWDQLHNYAGDQIVALERRYMRDLLNVLPFKLKRVMQMYYLEHRSYPEIGEAFGVSTSRICQLHRQSIEIIRAHLKKKKLI